MQEEYSSKRVGVYNIVMFFFTGIFIFLFSHFTGMGEDRSIRNAIVSMIFCGTLVFMLQDGQKRGEEAFYYDNYFNRHRYFIAYLVTVVLSCIFSMLPNVLWPYMSVFVILAAFSNFEIGLVSGIGFVCMSTMLQTNASYAEIIIYVLAGAVALCLLRDPYGEKGLVFPIFISLMMQAVLIASFALLSEESRFSGRLFLLPLLNTMVNMVVLFVFLNFLSVYIIGKGLDESDNSEVIENEDEPEEENAEDSQLKEAEEEKAVAEEASEDAEATAIEDKPQDDETGEEEQIDRDSKAPGDEQADIEAQTERADEADSEDSSDQAKDADGAGQKSGEAKVDSKITIPEAIKAEEANVKENAGTKENNKVKEALDTDVKEAVPAKRKRKRPKKKVLNMTLNVENEVQAEFDFNVNELAYEVAETVLKMEGCTDEVEVELIITDDEGIQELNRNFRDIDSPTDVLSFPNVSYDRAGDFAVLEGKQKIDLINPDTGKIMFGEIVLNEMRVRSQAIEYGHSEKREFSFLIAHSMLHLCGYDHMEEDEALVMEKKQEQALNELGITRDEIIPQGK